MCVNNIMHTIKVETLEATSTESLKVLKNQDPTELKLNKRIKASHYESLFALT